MKKSFPAHVKILSDGSEQIQSVMEHCSQSAEYAARSLKSIGLDTAAYYAAYLHDMGKCTELSRQYQEDAARGLPVKRGSVIHTFQGCRYVLEKHPYILSNDFSDISREVIAFAIGAHHGLFDCVDEHRKSGFQHRLTSENGLYEEAKENFLDACGGEQKLNALFDKANQQLITVFEKMGKLTQAFDRIQHTEIDFYVGMLCRLILSAVIEGDRRDTAEFVDNVAFPDFPDDMRTIWSERLAFMESKLDEFPQNTAIQKARRTISDQCRDAASKGSGILRINAPTGSGKTLSMVRYALSHAVHENKKRIIFTAPLLTILDQNSKIIREYIGDDSLVLEHYSNLINDRKDPDESLNNSELLVQNWQSPVIITTLVQLLNTLFSGKTTSIRRLWSLCDSIIIIDEVQSVPNKMLSMFNQAMTFLSEFCNTTVVLSSATQPSLEIAKHPIPYTPIDMIPHDPKIWNIFKRTEIIPVEDRPLDDITDFVFTIINECNSLLVICNKKAEAAKIYSEIADIYPNSYHLSAGMCKAHRETVLRNILQDLKICKETGSKVICIATQLVEAGFDASFERVIRFSAGLDSILQSAGRCNRNGEVSGQSPVYVVGCSDEKLGALIDIERGKNAYIDLKAGYSRQPERFTGDLSSDEAIKYYYESLYGNLPENAQDYPVREYPSIFSLLSDNKAFYGADTERYQSFFINQSFALAGRLFEVFDGGTYDVIVPYGKGKDLILELTGNSHHITAPYLKGWLKRASSYSVTLYAYQKKLLEENGGLYTINDILILQEENYDPEIGVISDHKNAAAFLNV